MTYRQFGIGLLISVVVATLGCLGLHATMDLQDSTMVTVGMGVLLAVVCIVMFWLGKRTAGAENKMLFGNVFMGLTGLKILLCGGILGAYIVLGKPSSSHFIVPVFFVYFVFTLLEVIALVRLSREAK